MSTVRYEAISLALPGLTPPDGVGLRDGEAGLEATVAPAAGGEVSSLRRRTPAGWRELLYRATDFAPAEGWRGRAPLLWPAVGRNFTPEHRARVAAGEAPARACSYQHGGQVYDIPIHGFAMHRAWALIGHGADAVGAWATCELTDDDDTRVRYPFAFTLRVTHRLAAGALASRYTVTARADNAEAMFFSIGNHISFQLPFADEGQFAECVLTAPTRTQLSLTPQSLLSGETERKDLTGGVALADVSLHNLVLGGFAPGQTWVELRDPAAFGLRVAQREVVPEGRAAKAAPEHFYFVFWGDPDLGLYCPEPWYGGPNSFNTREGVITLAAGDTFEWEMTVTVQP
jgi:galactose mutarotase-like enzyme